MGIHQGQKSQVSSRQDQREYFKSLARQPQSTSFIPEILDDLNSEQLKNQIVQKLQKIAEEIEDVEHFAEKQIPNQLKALKTVVSVMKTDDLKEMFQAVQSISSSSQQKQTVRNLFLSIVRNSGSPPAVMFLKEMIEQEQLTEAENYMVIVTLAHYMKVPTDQVICCSEEILAQGICQHGLCKHCQECLSEVFIGCLPFSSSPAIALHLRSVSPSCSRTS